MNKLLFLLAILTFLIPEISIAQINRIKKGDKVKIVAPSVAAGSIQGTVIAKSDLMFKLSVNDKLIDIPFASIKHLNIKRSYHRTVHGALVGAGAGGSAGLITGIIASQSGKCSDNDSFCVEPVKPGAMIAGIAGAGILVGGLIGAAIGSFMVKERWVEVNLNIGVTKYAFKMNRNEITPGLRIRVYFIQ